MLSRTYGIECDRCHEVVGCYADSQAARRAAAKAGWVRIRGDRYSGKDYCPPCGEVRSRGAGHLVERGGITRG